MNKKYLKAVLIQACEDIKNSADEIINGIDELNNIVISISFIDDSYPSINIDKNYNKYVTFTKEIERSIFDDGTDN